MIYKYIDIKSAKLLIKNNFLKFSSPNKFNDPYDIHISIKPYTSDDFFKLYDRKYKLSNLYENYLATGLYKSWGDFQERLKEDKFKKAILLYESKYIKEWLDNYQNMVSELFAVTCFSTNPTSILMWAHYAEKYQGCVLGFDYNEHPIYKQMIFKVRYRNKPLSMHAKYCYGHRNYKAMLNSLITKYSDWSYENEQRLVIPIKNLELKKTVKKKFSD